MKPWTVITGANRGIGLALAKQLNRQATVYLLSVGNHQMS